MKNKKIILTIILFLILTIIGTLKVSAAQEINTIEDMSKILGNENIEVNEEEIKLLNDIDLKDNLIIKNGKYILDLNGKTISYTKNNDIAFYMLGGNLTIKDKTNNGKLISNDGTIACYDGFLKVENCKVNNSINIGNEATVQIDEGEFSGVVIISAGNLIINDGLFKNGLEIAFEEFSDKLPNVIINDGEFIGQSAGLYIWFSHYAQNVQLKGGTFKGKDEGIPGIFVGEKFSLSNLLPFGYRFNNDEENIKEVIYDYGEDGQRIDYETTSANEVSVEKYLNREIIKLIFVDYDGNIIETKNIREGRIFTLPEAPEKEGYVFIGWDINPDEISCDTVVNPIYEKIYNLEVDIIYDACYTGEEIKPNLVVIDEITKERLSEEDYEIICENNLNVGTVDVLIQGKGKYKYSSKTAEFKILPKKFDYEFKLDYKKEFEYTGKEIKPNVSLIYKNIELINGVDYKVDYESNVEVGYGKIIIKGIGNYSGEKIEIFRINTIQIDEIILSQANIVYTGNEIRPEVIVKAGNKELINDVDYKISYFNNINIGTAFIIINGIGNYTGYAILEFNIISKDIQDLDIRIDLSNKQYTGKYIKSTIEIFDNDYKLRENKDFTVEYSNNLKIGKATIKITGKNGYSGTIVETFDIIPKTVKIKSIKSPIIRTVRLSWQKDSSVDGYEIYRSNNKEGTYSLVKTIDRNNKDNHTFLAHKKGTFYYVIRSYEIVDGNKIYSDFSEIKEIKVK